MTARMTIADAKILAPRRIAVTNDSAALSVLAQAAEAVGWGAFEHAQADITGAATAIATGSPAALVIVDLDTEADVFAALARLADACLVETRVIAIGSSNDVGLLKALLAEGVGDYLVKPLQLVGVTTALGRLFAPAAVAAATTGRVVAVLGVRGGCGATTLATSLAWVIAEAGQDVPSQRACILVDFDLHFGTAALAMGIEPGTGLAAMLASPDRLDAQLIASNLQPVAEKLGNALGVISAQVPVETDAPISPAAATTLLAALRTTAPWIIADLPRALDATTRQLLRTADQVLLVSPPSLEGLRDTGRLLTWLLALRAGAPPLIVVNGVNDSDGEIGRRLFEETLGQSVAGWLPALCGPAAAAAAHGVPLGAVAGGRAGNPFAELAAVVTGAKPAARRSRLPTWWPKW